MAFGQRLKELRLEHNLTQSQLAEKLNMSKANISKYESDSIQPNLETLNLIADIFGVTTDCLLGNSDSKESPSLDEQLEGIEYALFGEVKEMTEEQKQDLLNFAKFIRQQQGND